MGSTTKTVAGVIVEWEQTRTHVKPRTREMEDTFVRLYIRPALGRMKVRDITRGTIVKLLAGLTRQDGNDGPLSGGTKTLILSTLSSILDVAVDNGRTSARTAGSGHRRAGGSRRFRSSRTRAGRWPNTNSQPRTRARTRPYSSTRSALVVAVPRSRGRS